MLYHPYIMEKLIEQRQAELLAEVPKYPWALIKKPRESLIERLAVQVIILLADLLIKAGTGLKKQWALEEETSIDRYASSLNGE